MIPNNEPPAIVVPPSGSFTTPAPPRGAAPWPTATQRLFFFFLANFTLCPRSLYGAHQIDSHKKKWRDGAAKVSRNESGAQDAR